MPVFGTMLTAFNLVPDPQVDFATISIIVVGPIWAWAIFRHRMLDIMPVARDRVFDNVEDAIIVLDVDNVIIDVNPPARKLIRNEPIVGQNARQIFSPYRDLVDKYETATEARTEITVPVGKKERVYDLRISPLFHGNHKLVGRIVVLRDVTERARLIEELDAYAHTVAHDLKTPLTSIIGYVEMMNYFDRDHLSEDVQDYINNIGQSSQKMQAIIEDLLLMARVRGMSEVATDTIDMAAIVAAAKSRLNHIIQLNEVEIVQPQHWPGAQGYAAWIEEVWANYLSNAIKYGGTPPRIELGAETQSNGMVRFWVRDNGPGLTDDAQARLFQQFVQLNPELANGHGLGLSIVRRIVEKHGGQVGVESVMGAGSTFYFTLPAAARVTQPTPQGED